MAWVSLKQYSTIPISRAGWIISESALPLTDVSSSFGDFSAQRKKHLPENIIGKRFLSSRGGF
jgi:hypothetical protein